MAIDVMLETTERTEALAARTLIPLVFVEWLKYGPYIGSKVVHGYPLFGRLSASWRGHGTVPMREQRTYRQGEVTVTCVGVQASVLWELGQELGADNWVIGGAHSAESWIGDSR